MPNSGIYKIVNRINGKIYVGSAKNLKRRWNNHLSGFRKNKANQYFQKAWHKYGPEAFEFVVIEYCEIAKLIEREQYWFSWLKPFGDNGYNIAPVAGSTLGTKVEPQTVDKWRKSRELNGYSHTEEAKAKISSGMKGIKNRLGTRHSDETRLKLSQAKRKRDDRERGPLILTGPAIKIGE